MTYFYNSIEYKIVFNGEIYNYLELKNTLLKEGYIFNSNSDTEVLLVSYIHWGEKCIHKFNGMWAFAIYDMHSKNIFLSRDRIGKKPLFYYFKNGKFIFSSEIKAILEHENLNLRTIDAISKNAVDLYFSMGYIPAPYTIYSDINILEGGHSLLFSINDSKILYIKNYFDLPLININTNKSNLIEEGRYLLNDSVKLRMRSDVPVGAFLSGGLDSTSIVGEMKNFIDIEKLHTFSIGFDDIKFDETKYIKIAKNHYKTNHHHHIFDKKDFFNSLNIYAKYFDEPFADYSALAGFKVSEMASNYTKVVLSGDGGDEIFGGYPIYNAGLLYDKLLFIPKNVRKILLNSFNSLNIKSNFVNKIIELLSLTLFEKKYFYSEMFKNQRYRPEIYNDLTSQNLNKALTLANNSMSDGLRIYDLLFNTLSNNYLVKVDRTSMANSIEVRCPFLDYRFINFSQTIPTNLKVNLNENKILMRSIIKDIIPVSLLNRSKMGFTPPIYKWLYEFLTEDVFEKYLTYLDNFNSSLSFFYKKIYQQKVFNNRREYELIKLVIFANWFEYWIKPNEL